MSDDFSIDEDWPEEQTFLRLHLGDRLRRFGDMHSSVINDAIRAEAPVDTGRMKASIHADFSGTDDFFSYDFKATPRYTEYVLEGTAPHRIPAVGNNDPMLSFFWAKMGGARAFFRHVEHPGTRPDEFGVRGFERVEFEVRQGFHAAFSDL
jgi:hypothetical protein